MEGRTRSSGSRFCADRSEATTLNPHVGYPACLLSRQIPSPVWVHLHKTSTPGLEPGHPLKDYSRFSKPLPYQLGLCRHERRRQDLNLHGLSACLFSGQGLHQLSDCGKTLSTGFEPVHPYGWPSASNRAPCQLGQDSMKLISGPPWTRTRSAIKPRIYSPLRYQFRSPTHNVRSLYFAISHADRFATMFAHCRGIRLVAARKKAACLGKIRNRRLSDNIPYTVCILAGQGIYSAPRFLPNFSMRTSPSLPSGRDFDSSYE